MRMTHAQYIKKLKTDRAEQFQKTREVKIAMAKACRLFYMGRECEAIKTMLDCLGLPVNVTRPELEDLLAQLQKAVQDEGEKDKT